MSSRKPTADPQRQLKNKKAKLKDLAPKARAAQQVKGGPTGTPWAPVKGKNS